MKKIILSFILSTFMFTAAFASDYPTMGKASDYPTMGKTSDYPTMGKSMNTENNTATADYNTDEDEDSFYDWVSWFLS